MIIRFHDTVTKNEQFGYYEVRRVHSDGEVVVRRCGIAETKKPEEFLDRILSQHLSGTGAKRERIVDKKPRKPAKKKVAKKAAKRGAKKAVKKRR